VTPRPRPDGTAPGTTTADPARIPKLRAGSFFPSLLERRRRVEQSLFAVVMQVSRASPTRCSPRPKTGAGTGDAATSLRHRRDVLLGRRGRDLRAGEYLPGLARATQYCWTQRSRSGLICVGGSPKPMQRIRLHTTGDLPRDRLGALLGAAALIIPGLIVIPALAALFLAGAPPRAVLAAGAGAGSAVAAVAVHAAADLFPASWLRTHQAGRANQLRWIGDVVAGLSQRPPSAHGSCCRWSPAARWRSLSGSPGNPPTPAGSSRSRCTQPARPPPARSSR
jgi:Transposase, Mutator family